MQNQGSEEFNKKRQDVFGALDDIESAYSKRQVERGPRESESDRAGERGGRYSGYRQQESEFIRCNVEPAEIDRARQYRRTRRNVPDFIRRPSSYTYYDLRDVDDMSDKSNTQAAFAFLDELRKRKQAAAHDAAAADSEAEAGSRPTFRKPKVIAQSTAESEDDAMFGSFSTKKKQKLTSSTSKDSNQPVRSSGLSLAHLDGDSDPESSQPDTCDREPSKTNPDVSFRCSFRKARPMATNSEKLDQKDSNTE